MIPATSPRELDALRDRLLLALTEETERHGRGAVMVAVEPGAALLSEAGRLPLWILTQRATDTREALEARIRGAGHAVQGGPVAVSILSSEPIVATWARQMVDLVAPKVAAVYVLNDRGEVRTLSGAPLPVLERALGQAVHSDGFPPDHELERAIVERRRLQLKDVVETQSFAKRLGERRPVATHALMVACVAVFLLQLLWGGGDATLVAGRMGAGSGAKLAAGDWWRLFSPAFLHANWMHVGMNMVALYALGPTMESILGRSRFVVLYLACAIGASLTTGFLNPEISSVGASGAVWGLMGAMLGLAWRPNGVLPASVVTRLRKSMRTPLLINAGISFLPGIDMWGHFGGGAAGFVLLLSGVFTMGLRDPTAKPERMRRKLFTALAVVLSVAATASVATAIVRGQPWRINEPPTLAPMVLGDTGLVALLPEELASTTQDVSTGMLRLVMGDLAQDPAVVQISIAKARSTSLTRILAELDEEFSPATPARIENVDGRELAVVSSRQKGLHLEVAATHSDGREIAVVVVQLAKSQADWAGVASTIAASVRPQSQY